MATRKTARPDLSIIKKAGPHVRKMQAAKVKGGEEAPPGAEAALPELARLATQLQQARSKEAELTGTEAPAARTALPCAKYNTYWNAFKTLLGFRTEWDDCMCTNYGGGWCE
jgi:hypothetical protein